ncbi:MAG: hypothetical protein P8K64_03315 [Acidimicrobiales bacterium]|jgi:hypothetical protein|nr:hypothetical protein [Acidimicrobiales bacterium]
MPMRQECKQFESRTYPNGDTVRKCNLDLAPEAPWRCPENCSSYERRTVDVNWSHGTLITPATPEEPVGLGEDESIVHLLESVEGIVNAAAPQMQAEVEAERKKKKRSPRNMLKRKKQKKRKK